MAKNLFKTDADFTTAFTAAGKKQERSALDYQIAVYHLALRWKESGDAKTAVRRMNECVASMHKSADSNQMLRYAEVYLGMIYNSATKELVMGPDRAAKNLDTDRVKNNHWWLAKKKTEYQPLDIAAAFESLINKMQKDIEKLGDNSEVKPGLITKLRVIQTELASAE